MTTIVLIMPFGPRRKSTQRHIGRLQEASSSTVKACSEVALLGLRVIIEGGTDGDRRSRIDLPACKDCVYQKKCSGCYSHRKNATRAYTYLSNNQVTLTYFGALPEMAEI